MKTICKHAYPTDLCGTCNPPAKEEASCPSDATTCCASSFTPEEIARLYEAMGCYVKAREENAKLKTIIEDIRNVCTSDNESKDRFIRRVLAILGPANAEVRHGAKDADLD